MQIRPALTSFSQSALNSAQVFGIEAMPALSIAFFEPHIQLTRWMFIGAATQEPFGFITEINSGATTLSHPSALASASRLAVLPVAFHSAISGPFSCTAGGALPETTSARSFASVLAVWPEIGVCCQVPPAAVYISPSLLIAAASDPSDHWCSRLVFGSAIAAVAVSTAAATNAVAQIPNRKNFISVPSSFLCCAARLPVALE